MSFLARPVALALACVLFLASGPALAAPNDAATRVPATSGVQSTTGSATITGVLLDRDGGLPISHGTVTLYQGSTAVTSTTTKSNGTFTLANVAPGVYFVAYEALGYGTRRSNDVIVTAGSSTDLRTLLARSATATGNNLREIGRVSAASTVGNGTLATSTTIQQNLSSEVLQRQGYTRVGDALNTLPGANITGLSSSVGDDLGVDIRGFGSSETEVLLDGHPIGPQGVQGDTFGFQVSPTYAIANTQVTYGSGALGLYGTDAIGGTVDLQTINPTRENHFQVTQGIGYQGRHFSDFQATGSVLNHKLGFALVHANDGTYGPWPTQARLQPGLLAGDFSPTNIATNTYGTSASYALTTDLFKLKYNFSPQTSFEADAFDSNSFDDKTGNGDNCYYSYGIQFYNAQQASQASPNTYSIGSVTGNCPAGLVGATFDEKTLSCLTPGQYASRTTGLTGGGPGPFQEHRFHDYHGRIQTSLGKNTFTLDGFGNRYSTDYSRFVNGGNFDTQFYDETGLLLSDDIAGQYNDFGFGYFVQHQNHTGTFVDNSAPPPLNAGLLSGAKSIIGANYAFGIRNFFLRDQYTPRGPLSFYLNAWLKRDSVTQKQTLDPRLSLVFRASNSDVLRLTGGRSDGQPAPELLSGFSFNTDYGQNGNPNCGGLSSVGGIPNPNLAPETSIDYEFGYGHRFGGDSVINAAAYFAFEKNRIFPAQFPATNFPNIAIPTNLLNTFLGRINKLCGTTTAALANLSYSQYINASTSRYQGVELNGRYRLNRQLYVDYTGDIQSAVNLGTQPQILMSNVLLVDGSQIQGIPLQKYAAGLDFSDLHGFEARIDGYYIGSYNLYNRNPFFYANASFTKEFRRGTSVNIGVLNLFDSAASQLTVAGVAPFQGENQFGTDTSAIQQSSSQNILQTGLLPITAVLSITQRF